MDTLIRFSPEYGRWFAIDLEPCCFEKGSSWDQVRCSRNSEILWLG
ncbi:hypothetical protein Pan110_58510 [Gimesia panareensis]|nr:hypothetical protein Pan110_58510 [Gimesia panareensis]